MVSSFNLYLVQIGNHIIGTSALELHMCIQQLLTKTANYGLPMKTKKKLFFWWSTNDIAQGIHGWR